MLELIRKKEIFILKKKNKKKLKPITIYIYRVGDF